MSDIAELESRIAAAMGRIGQAVEAFTPAAATSPEELEEALAAVREAEARAEAAEAEAARVLEAGEFATAPLRQRIESLTAMKDQLQERVTELEDEVRILIELRNADRAELDELIAALEPLVREQTDA